MARRRVGAVRRKRRDGAKRSPHLFSLGSKPHGRKVNFSIDDWGLSCAATNGLHSCEHVVNPLVCRHLLLPRDAHLLIRSDADMLEDSREEAAVGRSVQHRRWCPRGADRVILLLNIWHDRTKQRRTRISRAKSVGTHPCSRKCSLPLLAQSTRSPLNDTVLYARRRPRSCALRHKWKPPC